MLLELKFCKLTTVGSCTFVLYAERTVFDCNLDILNMTDAAQSKDGGAVAIEVSTGAVPGEIVAANSGK